MSINIKGPGGPTGPGDVGDVAPKEKTAPGESTFAEKLGGPGAPGGPGGPADAARPDAVGAIAADLRAGKLSPQQALDRLVDLTINQGPAARLPETVKAKLRAELETLLKDDPMLAGKARRAGVGGDQE